MPHLQPATRLSFYLTLALSCLALGYAEWLFLPEVSVLAVLLLGLFAALYRYEESWQLAPIWANLLGGFITVVGLLYATIQTIRPHGPSHWLPWPTNLLPLAGPLLMVLMPAKLLRPKQPSDYWALFAISFCTVALACSLASDERLAVLIVLYLLSFVWALARLHRDLDRLPRRFGLATRSLRWSALALGGALVLFLLTPRHGGMQWEMLYSDRTALSTGYIGGLPEIDLNRAGRLEVANDLAFVVTAKHRDGTPAELDALQRWRGDSLYIYESGRLMNRLSQAPRGPRTFDMPRAAQGPTPKLAPRPGRLPDLGPQALELMFTLGGMPGQSPVLADPISPGPGGEAPALTIAEDRPYLWEWLPDGQLMTSIPQVVGKTYYLQALQPWPRGEPGPLVELGRVFLINNSDLQGMPKVRAWAVARLREAVAAGTMPNAIGLDALEAGGKLAPAYHSAAATALSGYLSRHYQYSLLLRRISSSEDPVEEFLFDTKEGHCERFAAALMVALRTLGVPSQVVLGFQGCEEIAKGQYEIRQSMAHAWVEIFLSEDDRPGDSAAVRGRWLPFDPTPNGGPVNEQVSLWDQWWQSFSGGDWFQNLIVGFNSEQRTRFFAAVLDGLKQLVRISVRWSGQPGFWLILAGTVVGLIALKRWRASRMRVVVAVRAPHWPALARLYAVLAKFGVQPVPTQTPREFADVAARWLALRPTAAPLAGLPQEVTADYYEWRFGGRSIPAERSDVYLLMLDDLERDLTTPPRGLA